MRHIYIISELCGQWGGSVQRAEQMILQSKLGGADAVKVQLYDTFKMPGENRELWEYLSFKKEDFLRLLDFSKKIGIEMFASVFDEERLHWINAIEGIKYHKIASMLLEFDFNLCKKIVDTGLTTFCSLGKWDKKEYPFQCQNVKYFHCVAEYPHTIQRAINCMPESFMNRLEGYSDHSIGIEAAKEAVRRGAIYIEKHFTISHDLQSKTESAHLCSMDFNQLIELRNFCEKTNG